MEKGVEQATLVQKAEEDGPRGEGLVDESVETPISQAGTSASSEDDLTRQTVKVDKGQAAPHCRYKYYAWGEVT